ncbi:MAG: MarR family transcriptional regulator [Frankia sp.]|nr:MarR family transcriptional regulator [Frankia sp.]
MIEPAAADTAADTAAREVWRAILGLTLMGEAHSRLHRVGQAVELTPAALKILLVLSRRTWPMRELVETFGYDPSYLTSIVDLLERRGLARREPHPTDRRAKTVVITDAGLAVLSQAKELLLVPPASFGVLTEAEQEQLVALLSRVVAAEPNIPEGMRPCPCNALVPGRREDGGSLAGAGRHRPADAKPLVRRRPPGCRRS